MKTSVLLLASVALNLLLAVLWLRRPSPEALATGSASPLAALPLSASALATNRSSGAPESSGSKPIKSFTWEVVESADYREYIRNLRSIGCPEETIRDIIVADVNKLFEERKARLQGTRKKLEYWKASSMFAMAAPDEELLKKKQELNQERRALLTELLGSAPEEKPDASTLLMESLEAMFDFLPPSKQTEVFEAMQRMQSKMMKSMGSGMPDQQDMKKMVQAQKDMEAEIAKLMTPEQFEQYQLRLSTTAMTMRMQLATFDPTEEEYKSIFKLRKAFDEDHNPMLMGSLTPEEREKRTSAESELNEKVKMLLGGERFTEYTRSQDYNYQGMAKVVERHNLPKETAVKVYDMKRIAEEQAAKLRGNSSLDPVRRDEALRAIRAETERSIQEAFGAEGAQSYLANPMARGWLDQLAPSQAVAPTAILPAPVVVRSP